MQNTLSKIEIRLHTYTLIANFIEKGYLSISKDSSSEGVQNDLYVVKKILTKAGSKA
jgi:hypothetical protein